MFTHALKFIPLRIRLEYKIGLPFKKLTTHQHPRIPLDLYVVIIIAGTMPKKKPSCPLCAQTLGKVTLTHTHTHTVYFVYNADKYL